MKASKKRAARLKARQNDYDNRVVKTFGTDKFHKSTAFHRPGSVKK